MIPTIQTEIELLQNTKDELRTAIMEKGVSVSSNDLFSTYPTRISQISMTPGDKDDLFKSLIDRSITSLVVPDGTEILRPHVFSGCLNITSLTLPNSLKIIHNGALTGLHGVTTLVIPDSVKRIESSSSYHATTTNLTSLTLGSGLEYIGNNAFRNNTNLTSITINAETPPTLNTNTNAFDNTNNCPIYVPAESVDTYKAAWTKYADRIQAMPQDNTLFNSIVDRSVTSINIPNNVTSIGNYAFQSCASLTNVTIPSSVTSIGKYAFNGCTSLTSATIGNGVTSIGNAAFQSCNRLTSIIIPSSVTSIGDYAFLNCTSLTNVTIPSSVTSIGKYAFNGCYGLTSVTINRNTPPTLGFSAFDNTNNGPIYVPEDSVDAYKSASNWSTLASRIQAIPS